MSAQTNMQTLADSIPVLRAEGCVMHGHTANDAAPLPPLAAFDGGARSLFVGGSLSLKRAHRAPTSCTGHWHLRGYGRWVVEGIATGAIPGAFGPTDREGSPVKADPAAQTRVGQTLGWTRLMRLSGPQNDRPVAPAERMGGKKGATFDRPIASTLTHCHPPGPEALT